VQYIELFAGMRVRTWLHRIDVLVVRLRLPEDRRRMHHGAHRLQQDDVVRRPRHM
jgi:hypothetical protein